MLLSIIVVNWNTRDLLAQCLKSVYAHPPDGEFEVIVVDNGSVDGSVTMVREAFPRVHLIENNENLGFARGNNQGIEISQGEYILLLNSDAILLENTIDPMILVMESNPETALIGPKVLNPDKSFQSSYARFPTLMREFLEHFGLAKRIWGYYYPSAGPEASHEPRVVDWVSGACLLARHSAIKQVGSLDGSIMMYGEEVDWCYRMKKAHWAIRFCPEASVLHYGSQSSIGNPSQKYIQIQRGKVLFFRKHRNSFQTSILIMFIKLSNLLKAFVYTLPNGIYKQTPTRQRETYLTAYRETY